MRRNEEMKEVVKELAGKFGIQVMLDSLSRLKGLGGGPWWGHLTESGVIARDGVLM
jgi:hypothetical protein